MEHKKYPTSNEAYEVFAKEIDNSPVINPERLKQSAKETIFNDGKYYEKFIDMVPADKLDTKTELQLNYTTPDGIKFNGNIDRVDKNPDGTYTIYDYKTGENSEGITAKGSHSDYYYQIGFYKYLFKKQFAIDADVSTSFLYPLIEESCVTKDLSDEECENIAKEFVECVNGINNCQFDRPEKCPKKTFCNCKDFCRNNVI